MLGTLSAAAVVPYTLALQAEQLNAAPLPLPLPLVLTLQILQTGILIFLAAIVGLKLGGAVGLDSPVARTWLDTKRCEMSGRHAAVSVGFGVLSAGVIVAGDAAFSIAMPPVPESVATELAWWKGLLASFSGGGIGEELLLRLGVMTLLTWLVWRFVHHRASPVPASAAWFGIVGASLLFGAGHLPAAAAIWPLTGVVITRTLVLNGIAGIVFGWLYWRRGLEYAMVAHFSADIVLQVLLASSATWN